MIEKLPDSSQKALLSEEELITKLTQLTEGRRYIMTYYTDYSPTNLVRFLVGLYLHTLEVRPLPILGNIIAPNGQTQLNYELMLGTEEQLHSAIELAKKGEFVGIKSLLFQESEFLKKYDLPTSQILANIEKKVPQQGDPINLE